MPFTFQVLSEDNSVSVAEISLAITPTTPIFTETDWVGNSSKTEIINVANENEEIDVNYFVSADWYAAAGGNAQDARLLAERLNIKVTADPGETGATELFDGKLADLIQQPTAGRALEADANEDVEFELSLPEAAATDLIQGMSLEFDLVFIAVTD